MIAIEELILKEANNRPDLFTTEVYAFSEGAKYQNNMVIETAIEKIERLRSIVNDHNERSGGRITGYNECIEILDSLRITHPERKKNHARK